MNVKDYDAMLLEDKIACDDKYHTAKLARLEATKEEEYWASESAKISAVMNRVGRAAREEAS